MKHGHDVGLERRFDPLGIELFDQLIEILEG